MAYSHHADKRPLGTVIAASNRMPGERDRIDWTRTVAVKVIKFALRELMPIPTSYKNGIRLRIKRWAKERDETLAWFDSAQFETWANCTNVCPAVWREAALAIYRGECRPRWTDD